MIHINKRLVIFDLDGTLINSLGDLAHSMNEILKRHQLPIHAIEQYKTFVGNGVSMLVKRALGEKGESDGYVQKLTKEFVDYYIAHSTVYTTPYPGVMELLKELKNKNVKLAVASNKFQRGTEELVAHFFREAGFDCVLGQRSGVPSKPDPSIVYETMEKLGVQPSEVLYVGDSDVDILTAKNSGVDSVGVTWGFRTAEELRNAGADYVIDEATELLKYI